MKTVLFHCGLCPIGSVRLYTYIRQLSFIMLFCEYHVRELDENIILYDLLAHLLYIHA